MAERDYFETLAEHLRELINAKPRSPSHEEVKSTLHLAVLSMIELEPEIPQGVRALRGAPRDREAWDVARAARLIPYLNNTEPHLLREKLWRRALAMARYCRSVDPRDPPPPRRERWASGQLSR